MYEQSVEMPQSLCEAVSTQSFNELINVNWNKKKIHIPVDI